MALDPLRPTSAGSAPTASVPEPRGPSSPSSGFRDALRRMAEGDRALATIVSGGAGAAPIDSGELLRLQATVYRSTQELDLAGRLLDKATQAVKTTLQSQS